MEAPKEKTKLSYDSLWKFIIRPERDIYTEDLLGYSIFSLKGKTYTRKDYELISSEGYKMKCSFFEPEDSSRPKFIMPVILYLHGNCSSRLEGISLQKEILKREINLFVVDFPGCGLSEGEYISLGYHESHDVKILVDFISKLPGVGNIGIWGRSMGAATTMIYAHKDKRVKAICLDSPFADFNLLAKDLVLTKITIPKFLIDGALKIVRMIVKKKNGLDIDKLKPIDAAPKTTQPVLFIHANEDELINNKHSEMLLKAYKGKDKTLEKCKGGHNTKRPSKIMRKIGEFFLSNLFGEKKEEKKLKVVGNIFENFNFEPEENIINNKENEKNELDKSSSTNSTDNEIENKEEPLKEEIKGNEMDKLKDELTKCFKIDEEKKE